MLSLSWLRLILLAGRYARTLGRFGRREVMCGLMYKSWVDGKGGGSVIQGELSIRMVRLL